MVMSISSKLIKLMSIILTCFIVSLTFGNIFSAASLSIDGASSSNSINPNSYATNGDFVFLNFSSNETLDTNVLEVYLEGIPAAVGGPGPNFTYTAVAIISGLDQDHILDYNFTNFKGFLSSSPAVNITGTTSSMRIDTRAPVFDEVVTSPASGILGVGDDIDYTLRIVNLDSSAGVTTNNGLTITVNNYTSANDVSFISVSGSNQFNDNNVVVPNGVYGTLEISGVTFFDRAGNNITNFSSITTNITIDTIAPSSLVLSNTNIGEFLPSGTSVGNVTIVDIGDQNFTYSLSGVDSGSFSISNTGEVTTSSLLFKGEYELSINGFDSANNSIQENFTIVVSDGLAPYNIRFSNSNVLENASIGTIIGTVLADDDGTIVSYNLEDSSNGTFGLNGTLLFLAKELDFETQSSYSISVSVTDDDNQTSYENVLISVVNIVENDAPENVFLTNSIIPENLGANYTIGEFIVIDESFDNHTFTINNSNFIIVGNELITSVNLENGSYLVTVNVTDLANNSISKDIIIQVTDNINLPPQNILLQNNIILENTSIYSLVGEILAEDFENENITFNVTDLTGNNSFIVVGNFLFTNTSFNYEENSIYSIIISATDESNQTSYEQFNIFILPDNNNPKNFFLTNNAIPENVGINFEVGEFIVIDELFDNHTFSVNSSDFYILDNSLYTNTTLTNGTYVLNITVFDLYNNSLSKEFEIIVTDVNSAPFNFTISNVFVYEDEDSGYVIANISAQDLENDDLTFFMLSGDLGVEVIMINSTTAQLIVSSFYLDYEDVSEFELVIGVSDSEILSVFNSTIYVEDVNEELFFLNGNDFTLLEDLWTHNQYVGTIDVDDFDDNLSFRNFTFEITQNYGVDGYFYINETTGDLYVNDPYNSLQIDFDEFNNSDGSDEEFTIDVSVDDGEFIIYRTVTIYVQNSNDLGPFDIFMDLNLDIFESQINDSFGNIFSRIGTIFANLRGDDYDKGQELDNFTFEIVGISYYPSFNDSMNFSVLNLSSRVSQLETASEFNYEFRDTYYVNISIYDGLNAKYYELFELSITDINDNPTNIMIENLSFEENNIENELLSLISVIDQDFEENLTITFNSILDDNFSLNDSRVDITSVIHNINESVNKTENYVNSSIYIVDSINFEDYVLRGTNPNATLNLSFLLQNTTPNITEISINVSDLRFNSTLINASINDISDYLETIFNTTNVSGNIISISAPIETIYYNSNISITTYFISNTSSSSLGTIYNLTGTQPYLQIDLTAKDKENLTVSKVFNITIEDSRNESPYDMNLSGFEFNETSRHCIDGDEFQSKCNAINNNSFDQLFIGNLSTLDEDDLKFLIIENFTYSLNSSYYGYNMFTVINNSLYTNAAFDFETQDNYTIGLIVEDRNGLTYFEEFNVSVLNVHEEPELSFSFENNSIITTTNLTSVLNELNFTDDALLYLYNTTQNLSMYVVSENDSLYSTNMQNLSNGIEYNLVIELNDSQFSNQTIAYNFVVIDTSNISINVFSKELNLTVGNYSLDNYTTNSSTFDFEVISYNNDSTPFFSFVFRDVTVSEINGLNISLLKDINFTTNYSLALAIENLNNFRNNTNLDAEVRFYIENYNNSKDYFIAHCSNNTDLICNDVFTNLTTSTVGFDSNLSMYYVSVSADSFSIFAVYDEDKPVVTSTTSTTSSSGGGGGGGSSSTSTVEINLDTIEGDETFTLSTRDEVTLQLNNIEIGTIEIVQINFNGDIELKVDSNTIIVSQGDRIFVRGLLGSEYELTIIQSNSIRASLELQIINTKNNNVIETIVENNSSNSTNNETSNLLDSLGPNLDDTTLLDVIDSVIENANLSVEESQVDNSVSGQFTSDYTDSIIVILLSLLIIGGIIFIALRK